MRAATISPTHDDVSTPVPHATASRVIATLLVLALACVALAACGGTEPSGPADITGTVTSLVPGDERPASILVEASATASGAGNKAQVTIEPQTLFFDAAGKPGGASSIKVGTKVSVWFTGAVAESYPVQGTAQDVKVLGN